MTLLQSEGGKNTYDSRMISTALQHPKKTYVSFEAIDLPTNRHGVDISIETSKDTVTTRKRETLQRI